jgi:hypothetical protein
MLPPPTTVRPARDVRAAALLALWIAALVAVIIGFGALGGGALAPPPLTDPGGWGPWAAGREPLEAAFAVLRVVVIALAWYLLAVTVLAAGSRLLRPGRMVTVVDVLTIPFVRRVVQGAVGVGLATAAVAGVGSRVLAGGTTRPTPTAADIELAASRGEAATDLPTMRRLGDETEPTVRHLDGSDPPDAARDSVEDAARWEVQPGQHLWSIATSVLEGAWGRAPTDAEVTPYWVELIEANRAALADPQNPDLIHPGQVFRLPAVPAPPAG